MRRVRAIPKEKVAKIAEARKAWKARKVQVLVEDPEIPDGYELRLELGKLEQYLEGLEVPTRVIISGRVYKVKLRKYVEHARYREILDGLNSLAPARWSREDRAIIVTRAVEVQQQEEPEEEELDIEVIVIPKKQEARA